MKCFVLRPQKKQKKKPIDKVTKEEKKSRPSLEVVVVAYRRNARKKTEDSVDLLPTVDPCPTARTHGSG